MPLLLKSQIWCKCWGKRIILQWREFCRSSDRSTLKRCGIAGPPWTVSDRNSLVFATRFKTWQSCWSPNNSSSSIRATAQHFQPSMLRALWSHYQSQSSQQRRLEDPVRGQGRMQTQLWGHFRHPWPRNRESSKNRRKTCQLLSLSHQPHLKWRTRPQQQWPQQQWPQQQWPRLITVTLIHWSSFNIKCRYKERTLLCSDSVVFLVLWGWQHLW